ncbi:hypothetical protein DACRYDRAFT_116436 [Dacryopinax primogenitus]|uniref:Uncharacterized protein n=1 Tax=Dacryopinax primogenitus (strain DJM 731) TaxID=1858805 RepID=M5G1H2_DACPD|nr:uncharacterized protein DACRYDRAFT_116436 [Dacryopinax primogenitus]EJU02055.1 hypothetical protein DACRYDRAFT_116436 [Dacryopinax primogenitus]
MGNTIKVLPDSLVLPYEMDGMGSPAPSLTDVTFLAPLRIGPAHWAQVWQAEVDIPRTSATNTHSSRVVVKLYDPAWFPEGDSDSSAMAEDIAGREAWAYATGRELQGTRLPESYGFYWFNLNGGRVVCGHVMEFLDGDPPERDWRSVKAGTWDEGEDRRMEEMADMMDGLNELHNHLICHGDLSRRNVLMRRVPVPVQKGTKACRFCFLDFGRARKISLVPCFSTRDIARYGDDAYGVFSCLGGIEDYRRLVRWIMDNRQQCEWGRVFQDARRMNTLVQGAVVMEKTYRTRAGVDFM